MAKTGQAAHQRRLTSRRCSDRLNMHDAFVFMMLYRIFACAVCYPVLSSNVAVRFMIKVIHSYDKCLCNKYQINLLTYNVYMYVCIMLCKTIMSVVRLYLKKGKVIVFFFK